MSLFETETDLLIFMYKYRTKEDIERGLLKKMEELAEDAKFWKSGKIYAQTMYELNQIKNVFNKRED